MIPVYKPYFPKGSLKYAHDALDSTWVSSKGMYLNKVKEKLSEYWGTEYIILTNNGTAANHLIAMALKEKYPARRNIITGNNVYVAAWNPFVLEGFDIGAVEADEKTWNFDLSKLDEHWSYIIMGVHNLGNIINIPWLKSKLPNTPIIEDNCEGFGGEYEGQPSGTAAEMFSMSFFGNKNITSGEGGAFVTYDEESYDIAFRSWGQGMAQDGERFIHAGIGYNYRMTNVEAAILYGQLEIMDEIIERKEELYHHYESFFGLMNGMETQKTQLGTKHSNWMFGVRIPGGSYKDAGPFLSELGIETRPMFYPITHHGHFKDKRCKTDIAEKLSEEIIVLPSYPGITKSEQRFIIEGVKLYVSELGLL